MRNIDDGLTDPILIVSVGRSGSTLLHRLLARNPSLAWLSAASARFPEYPVANRSVMSAIDVPLLGHFLQTQIHPIEAYAFWTQYAPGFSEPARDIGADDLSTSVADRTRAALVAMQTERRDRILLKVTGWPRVGFLDALLPGSQFVHIVRDPRPVVSSLLSVSWWDGYAGPSRWRYGPLSDEDQAEWNDLGQSWAALAAIQWRMQVRAAVESLNQLSGDRALLVRYEDLLSRPETIMSDLSQALGLDWDERSRRSLTVEVRPDSQNWRRDLSSKDLRDISQIARESASLFGYEV